MVGARTVLSVSLGLALVAAAAPASAQVGIPQGQIYPYGYQPPQRGEPPPGYGQPQQTRYVSPVAMGFGIALAVIGVGMTVGGFIGIATDKDGNKQAMSSALLGVGGTCIAGSIPLIIYGAREVPVYAPNGYGPMTKAPTWLGEPRLVLANPKHGAPLGATWAWQF